MSEGRKLFAWMLGIILVIGLPLGIFMFNNRPPNIHVPTPKLPSPNAWDDFGRACKMLKSKQFPGPLSDTKKKPEQWTLQDYRVFLAANGPAIAAWRKALPEPYAVPPIRSIADSANGFENYARFREMARTVTGEGMYYEKIGQYGKAMGSYLDVIEFGGTIPRGGRLVQGIVGDAIQCVVGRRVGNVIPKMNANDLVQTASRLEQIWAKRVPYSEIVMEEGYVNVAILNEQLSEHNRIDSIRDPSNVLGAGEPIGRAKQMGFAVANKAHVVRDVLAYYQALAAEQRGYYTGRSLVPVPRYLPADVASTLFDLTGRQSVPFVLAETRLQVMRAEIAVRRYRFDHGSFPAALADLVPIYLKSVPIDPFGKGKSLKYRQLKSGSDYLLYSIGPDMKNDGGKATEWGLGFDSGKPGDLLLSHAP